MGLGRTLGGVSPGPVSFQGRRDPVKQPLIDVVPGLTVMKGDLLAGLNVAQGMEIRAEKL